MKDSEESKTEDAIDSNESNVDAIYRIQEQLWFKRELRKRSAVKYEGDEEIDEKIVKSKDMLKKKRSKNLEKKKERKDSIKSVNLKDSKKLQRSKMEEKTKKEHKKKISKKVKTSPDLSFVSEATVYNLQKIIDSLESPKKQTETSTSTEERDMSSTKTAEDNIKCSVPDESESNDVKNSDEEKQKNSNPEKKKSFVKRKKLRSQKFRAPLKTTSNDKEMKAKQKVDKDKSSSKDQSKKSSEEESENWTSFTSEERELMDGTRKFSDCKVSKEMDIWN